MRDVLTVDVDDGDDMMVTIMSRTVTWMHLSGLYSQMASQPRKFIA